MLFNSTIFLLAFLPFTLAGFYLLANKDKKWRIYWLSMASFVFYGWWNPPYLLLLIGSIIVNFSLGKTIEKSGKRWILIGGIGFNLGLIAYYKYALFLCSMLAETMGMPIPQSVESILLPLGISFFTFQQIAYLVDTYRGKVVGHNFAEYTLFVNFFPQLVAGPIVHQKDILPQLARPRFSVHSGKIAVGITLFIMGLAKKTVLADPLGNIATPLFAASLDGDIGFYAAWQAALSYTLQLYFDFSAYSDMAIGLGLLFGIQLPLNFYSPYKATNIIDFWRRWHMTLSRFLRDYLYIPLGGNKKGASRRHINLMITMLLGGLWHGASWTFVAWGGLHGLFLVINHIWSAAGLKMPRILGWVITFLAVVFAWVLFRAENFESALRIYSAMLSPSLPQGGWDMTDAAHWLMVSGALIIALALPNIYQWIKICRFDLNKERWISGDFWWGRVPVIGRWKAGVLQGLTAGLTLWICMLAIQFVQSEFLYFNF